MSSFEWSTNFIYVLKHITCGSNRCSVLYNCFQRIKCHCTLARCCLGYIKFDCRTNYQDFFMQPEVWELSQLRTDWISDSYIEDVLRTMLFFAGTENRLKKTANVIPESDGNTTKTAFPSFNNRFNTKHIGTDEEKILLIVETCNMDFLLDKHDVLVIQSSIDVFKQTDVPHLDPSISLRSAEHLILAVYHGHYKI